MLLSLRVGRRGDTIVVTTQARDFKISALPARFRRARCLSARQSLEDPDATPGIGECQHEKQHGNEMHFMVHMDPYSK